MSKIFIDTNILVYAADMSEPLKSKQSRVIIKTLQNNQVGVISTQILQEFYVAATKKLRIDPLIAKSIIHNMRNLEIVAVDAELIEEAVDCSVLNRLSFWDALVVVSAEKANCQTLWTEDLNHGQTIRGVKIENPYLETNKPERGSIGELHERIQGVYPSDN